MQSELLYRRYLNKGDIFVHADLEGATPMVVKNRAGSADAPISPSTLSQAGNLCVATSTAWDSKAVMSAWWAHAHQVSKIADNGSGILPTGAFQIKGEKNFLAPSQLVLGFGIMFQISKESSVKNHKQRFDAFEIPQIDATPAGPVAASESKETSTVTQEVTEKENAPEATAPMKKEAELSEDEEDEDDKAAARNPLQRGDSELPAAHPSQEPEFESESEPEAEPSEEVAEPASEGEEEAASATQSVSQEPEDQKLSARERRTLRQGKPLDRDEEPAAPRIAPTRAKRAKDKRAAAKYAHQDEEERELALRLVGANKGKAAKAAKAAEAKEQRERDAEAQRQRRRAQHERAAEAERKRQATFTETGTDDYNEETAAAEAADLAWIPALIGTPTTDDEIIAAIPVCAPWGALGRYKYKVKLQPGAVKKGKAVKEMVGRWVHETTTGKVKKEYAEDAGIPRVDAERLRAQEGDLIKGWKESEIINTLPVGKVRIMTPGGAGGSSGGGDKGKGGKGGGGPKGGKGKKK
jgi:hypothetical protein